LNINNIGDEMKNGYLVELTFVNYLNDKLYKQTNPLFQDLLKTLYPRIKENDKIIAYKYGKYAKADIVIIVRGKRKGISIKTGSKNSVHLGNIDKFTKFLLSNGYTKTDELKRYLYSDGTNNNTGKIRLTVDEYKCFNLREIEDINDEIDKIRKKLIMRFLIKTDINYKVEVDAFIYGYVNDFLWATKDEVVDFLCEKKLESSGVHVSSLFLQNWDKNIKRNDKYEYCRNYIQIKWYSLLGDLIFIMNKRVEHHANCLNYKEKNSVKSKFSNNHMERLPKMNDTFDKLIHLYLMY